jgi:hypothetical protein
MGLLIKKTDFTGKYALSLSISDSIDSFIAEYEAVYLRDLLGASLYTLFAADISNNAPQTNKYQSLFNVIAEDYNKEVIQNRGMKKMLIGFIWWEYVRLNKYKHTGTGVVVDSHEVSREADNTEEFLYSMYNESVRDYKVIQWYINQHLTDYPEFAGKVKKLSYW